MVARVTDIQQTKLFVDQINTQKSLYNKTSREVSSGLRVSAASDDPGRAGTISELQSTVLRLNRHKERIGISTSLLEAQESALSVTQDIILRCKEIAIQSANETISDDLRASLSREVFQLRDQLIGVVNSRVQGSYIYGGAQDDQAPFVLAEDGYTWPDTTDPNFQDDISREANQRYIWTGDDSALDSGTNPIGNPLVGVAQTRNLQITDSEQVRLNSSAEVFRDTVTALEVLGRALAGYETTTTTYANGATNGYTAQHDVPDRGGEDWSATLTDEEAYDRQTAAILEAVDLLNDASVNDIEVERTSVGARMARMEQSRAMLDVLILDAEKSRAAIQDADIFDAATRLSSMEVSLQALLSTGSRISSLTLLNYI